MKTLPLGTLLLVIAIFGAAGCRQWSSGARRAAPETPTIEVILTGLNNPRGVAVGQAGELYVAEAGTGYDAVDPTLWIGRLTRFADINGDGGFDDEGESEPWFSHLPTYNALHLFDTQRDEVSGPGDLLLHRDGRLFLAVDGGFEKQALYEISPEGIMGRNLAARSNMNGIAFDREQERIYVVESTLNQLTEVTLDGELRVILGFPLLDSGQQAVPAGLAVEPQSGHVWVALFSGVAVEEESGAFIPFVPGDARVVRVDPETGRLTGEIAGLTTAVDVAVDGAGNLFVVELSSAYADLLPLHFDLFDPDVPPLHGGYRRMDGRLTLYPHGTGPPQVLARGLDAPTNITLGLDGALYVSTGQGTPGRPIPGPTGPTRIVGELLRITNYLNAGDR